MLENIIDSGFEGLIFAVNPKRVELEDEWWVASVAVAVTQSNLLADPLANLAQAITAPGDVVLAPNPSYPIHTFGFIIAGATIRAVPTTPDDAYFESLERAMNFTVPRPSILVVNYPSNPTAEAVDLAFYERLVAWAKENKVWIISDLAYSELYYDGNPTPSILQVKGAKDVAIEFTSLSKTYSMAGWRIGFAVGNRQLIAAMTRVKSYLDYGAFTPVQAAACAALNGPQDIVEKNRALYHKRRDVLVEVMGRAGWRIPPPRASMFAWAPLPPALKDMGSLEFSKQLLTHADGAQARGVDTVFDELEDHYSGPVTVTQDLTVFNVTADAVVAQRGGGGGDRGGGRRGDARRGARLSARRRRGGSYRSRGPASVAGDPGCSGLRRPGPPACSQRTVRHQRVDLSPAARLGREGQSVRRRAAPAQ